MLMKGKILDLFPIYTKIIYMEKQPEKLTADNFEWGETVNHSFKCSINISINILLVHKYAAEFQVIWFIVEENLFATLGS